MAYMLEGGASKSFSKARRLLFANPNLAHELLRKIAGTVICYLRKKIAAGVDVIQLFDSRAGVLSPEWYRAFSIPYLRRICESITEVPLIVFAKDAWFSFGELVALPCAALGIDWAMHPAWAREIAGPAKVLQGNLDPTKR